MNRKELIVLRNHLHGDAYSSACWRELTPSDLHRVRIAVGEARDKWSYRAAETNLLTLVGALTLASALTLTLTLTYPKPHSPMAHLLASIAVTFAWSMLLLTMGLSSLLSLVRKWRLGHLDDLADALEPLAASSEGGIEALDLVQKSPSCQRYRREVLDTGRQFLAGDLTVMRHLARQDLADEEADKRRDACQALHLSSPATLMYWS